MFLQASVCPQRTCVVEGCVWLGWHVWMLGMYMAWGVCEARGHAWQGDMHGRGVCVAGGYAWGHAWQGACMVGRGGMCAGETVTEVGGTHPTGMHSCSILYFNFTLY